MKKICKNFRLFIVSIGVLSLLTLSACAATASAANSEPSAPERVAYLTFDDGPYREITPDILDLLRQEEILATFFVLPHKTVDDIFRRIIREGHELGNHSYSHNYDILYRGNLDDFRQEVVMAHEFILNNFGYEMTSFRFPGGPFGHDESVFEERRTIIAELGYRDFAWHVDSNDWRPNVRHITSAELAERVLNDVDALEDDEHVIILFHDVFWSPRLLDALPIIISGLRERGFTFDVTRNFPLTEIETAMYIKRNLTRLKNERQQEFLEALSEMNLKQR